MPPMEAEYIAACEGAKDAACTQQLLDELGLSLNPTVKTNSEGTFNLAHTSRCLRRTRHIEHRYHYLRQQVQADRLAIATILGKENLADILTKINPMATIKKWQDRWMRLAE